MCVFHLFCEPFWAAAEAFHKSAKGFPLSLLLPITPATRCNMFGIWMANSLAETICVFDVPNLYSVGTPEPETYGHAMFGFGIDSCRLAIDGLAAKIGVKTKA
jgi:hypothetical protein